MKLIHLWKLETPIRILYSKFQLEGIETFTVIFVHRTCIEPKCIKKKLTITNSITLGSINYFRIITSTILRLKKRIIIVPISIIIRQSQLLFQPKFRYDFSKDSAGNWFCWHEKFIILIFKNSNRKKHTASQLFKNSDRKKDVFPYWAYNSTTLNLQKMQQHHCCFKDA